MLNLFASFLVVLSVAGSVPAAFGLAVDTRSCALCSPVHAVGDEALHPSRLPAEPTASRDGGRSKIAAAWRSIQLHAGLVHAGVSTPIPHRSDALDRAACAPGSSAPRSTSPVRGPPSLI
jgi:hypothetical protein